MHTTRQSRLAPDLNTCLGYNNSDLIEKEPNRNEVERFLVSSISLRVETKSESKGGIKNDK